MAAADGSSPSPSARALDRAHALAAVLPAAVPLWPGPWAPLAGDLLPELSAAGWAALASIPACLLLALRARPQPRSVWLLVGFLLAGQLPFLARPPSDTLEASRSGLLGLAALVALMSGASLGELGRRWLAGLVVGLALLALLPAVFVPAVQLEGALGNKAATSEAALGGALVGAVALALPARGLRLAGASAALLCAGYAGRAGVLSGALVLGSSLSAALLLAPRGPGGSARRRALVAALCACVLAVLGGRLARSAPLADHAAPTAATLRGDVRGLEVRALIARSALSMLCAKPWLGVGPGQFASAFPPWRSGREIELSTLGRALRETTEVEHAHDDWLEGVIETGLCGGAFWLALLLCVLARSLSGLRAQEDTHAALSVGALGLLAEALARAPLLFDPASSCTAFALFGAVLARSVAAPRRSALARLVACAVLLLLIAGAPRAAAIVSHGRALARLPVKGVEAEALLARALEACPDSVLALSLQARLRARERPLEATELWQRVLALRPHRFEAWMELGNAWARRGRIEEARAAYGRALALDPGQPRLLLNLATLEVEAADAAAALVYVERLERDGRLADGWLDAAALSALEHLDLATARALLRRSHPGWGALEAQEAWERAQELERESPALALSLEGLAHLEWAREQIAAGDPATAVRSYGQAVRGFARASAEAGEARVPPALRLELAAALLLAGHREPAALEAAGGASSGPELARLPAWAAAALMEAGLLGR